MAFIAIHLDRAESAAWPRPDLRRNLTCHAILLAVGVGPLGPGGVEALALANALHHLQHQGQ